MILLLTIIMYTHLLIENRKLKFEGCICVLSEMKINEKTHTTIYCFINTHTTITIVTSTCDHKQSRKLLHQSVNGVTVFSTKSQFRAILQDETDCVRYSRACRVGLHGRSSHNTVSCQPTVDLLHIRSATCRRVADHSSSRNAIPRFVGLALSSDKP